MSDSFILQCSPYTFKVESGFNEVSSVLLNMYGERLSPADSFEGFVDYNVALSNTTGLRQFLKPQARFLCDDYEPFKPLARQQAYALLEWGLNWVVSAHEFSYIIVHAAVLAKGNKAIIFPAESGSGKSTLTAYLSRNGWRLLSDEMALLIPNTTSVAPFVRPICLKNSSIELAKSWFPDAYFSYIAKETHKGDIIHMQPDAESLSMADVNADVVSVVFPKYDKNCFLDIYQVDKAGCFQGLTQNAFNHSILGNDGLDTLIDVVEKTSCYEIHYNNMQEVNQFLCEVVQAHE